MKNEVFRIHGVNYADEGKNILSQVSLNLYQGEILGLAGGISSGKSLILEILSGKKKPSAGYLFASGQLLPWSKVSLLNVKIIGHDYGLVGTLAIWENMLLIWQQACIHKPFFSPSAQISCIASFFKKYDVYLNPSLRAEELFDFQKLLVSVLLAVYCGFKTIFLDDFNYEYSIQEQREIDKLLKKLAKDGISFVLSSLSSTSIEPLCSRIVFVSEGCTFYTVDYSSRTLPGYQVMNLRESMYKVGSYRIREKNSTVSTQAQRSFSFEGESFSVFPGEYIGIIDPGREQINRMFSSGVSYQTGQRRTCRWFESDLMLVNIPDLSHVVEWMSPAENICLGLFSRVSSQGVLSPTRLSFIGKQFAQWRNNPELALRTDCCGMSKKDAIALSIFRIKLAKPKILFFRGLFAGTDAYVRGLITQTFAELLAQGTTICACVAVDYFEDFADRYIVLQKGKSFSGLSYQQARMVACGSTESVGG